MLRVLQFLQKSYFELAIRRYPLFPICYLSAIAGTMCICEFSVLCCQIKGVHAAFEYLGKNSIFLLCIHCLDSFWRKIWYVANRQYLTALKRLICDLLLFAFLMCFIEIERQLNKRLSVERK